MLVGILDVFCPLQFCKLPMLSCALPLHIMCFYMFYTQIQLFQRFFSFQSEVEVRWFVVEKVTVVRRTWQFCTRLSSVDFLKWLSENLSFPLVVSQEHHFFEVHWCWLQFHHRHPLSRSALSAKKRFWRGVR